MPSTLCNLPGITGLGKRVTVPSKIPDVLQDGNTKIIKVIYYMDKYH